METNTMNELKVTRGGEGHVEEKAARERDLAGIRELEGHTQFI